MTDPKTSDSPALADDRVGLAFADGAGPDAAAAAAAATPSGPVPAIEVENVVHLFKDHRALDGISFNVPAGSLHGFVGPNGAGKTTSLKIICTLLKPQFGQVRVFGHDVRTDVREIRRRLGFMPDHFSMYRQMTVYEYLDFFAAAYGFGLKDRTDICQNVLELTEMDGRKDDLISGLSRGMQQRVSLARVLVNDPDLLLLDEPASGLDPRARIELMDILKALKEMGKTVFISSHILAELAELCDSCTIIDRGKTKFSGTMRQLRKMHADGAVYRVRLADGSPDVMDEVGQSPGVQSVEFDSALGEHKLRLEEGQLDGRGLMRLLLDAGADVALFREDEVALNEAFMALTERGVRD